MPSRHEAEAPKQVLGAQQRFDRAALVHRPVAFRYLVQRQLDIALKN